MDEDLVAEILDMIENFKSVNNLEDEELVFIQSNDGFGQNFNISIQVFCSLFFNNLPASTVIAELTEQLPSVEVIINDESGGYVVAVARSCLQSE